MRTAPGNPLILGASLSPQGVNFALYSSSASRIFLALFEHQDDALPASEIELDPVINRTGEVWHILVFGLKRAQLYAWRVENPNLKINRIARNKFLVDPYAKAVTGLPQSPKAVVVDDQFDWQGVEKPYIPWKDTIIYETHLRGFTIHPSSGVKYPGTYRGVIEKIDYFKDLGITAIEFLPLQEFNHLEKPHLNPVTKELMGNYWGYSTLAFFAPKGSYSGSGDCGQQVSEFKEMVRELHRAKIEVILDVVFNHTAEMERKGPVYNYKALAEDTYYLFDKETREYLNLSGCGNTFACNHPVVADLILNCLRYWAVEMKVDGFRFDLAAIFNRDQDGNWSENSLLLQRINCDPILKEIKLIAEPWDAAAGYNAGRFGGLNWADWNDRFRDDVRRFWRGDIDSIGNFATRFAGSEDLFWSKKSPLKSINFITCHDGFTLNDLVSYRKKHNFANGHLNRDGRNENFSQNFRTEGETDDPKILNQRLRTIKNFLLILFLSQGVPMLSGGDEFLRTQKGNNNPYRQDNEITWYNWNLYLKNHSIFRFCQELIRFRKRHPAFSRSGFFTGFAHSGGVKPDILWFGPKGKIQDWNGANRTLGILINGKKSESGAQNDDDDLYIMFNSHKKELTFVIPPSPQGKKWHLAIDTGAESPADIFTLGGEPELQKLKKLKLKSLSAVVLIAR